MNDIRKGNCRIIVEFIHRLDKLKRFISNEDDGFLFVEFKSVKLHEHIIISSIHDQQICVNKRDALLLQYINEVR